MKVCAENRRSLAWLAIGALDESAARDVRAHVAVCAGCRAYLAEMEDVVKQARGAEASPMEASPFLRQRVRHSLRQERRQPAHFLRIALPGLGFGVALVLFFSRLGPFPTAPPDPAPKQATAAIASDMTLRNYEAAASQSLDKLDHILTEQGRGALLFAPVYQAGNSPAE
jgi:anti-sigma factor RsiW